MIFHILTAVLVVLRALGHIDLSYWWCVAPSLIPFLFFVGCVALMCVISIVTGTPLKLTKKD